MVTFALTRVLINRFLLKSTSGDSTESEYRRHNPSLVETGGRSGPKFKVQTERKTRCHPSNGGENRGVRGRIIYPVFPTRLQSVSFKGSCLVARRSGIHKLFTTENNDEEQNQH